MLHETLYVSWNIIWIMAYLWKCIHLEHNLSWTERKWVFEGSVGAVFRARGEACAPEPHGRMREKNNCLSQLILRLLSDKKDVCIWYNFWKIGRSWILAIIFLLVLCSLSGTIHKQNLKFFLLVPHLSKVFAGIILHDLCFLWHVNLIRFYDSK